MKRLLKINRRGSHDATDSSDANGDTPEASVARGVRLFCESGGQNTSGEEVLHLPVIVEAAESSPTAAREAANRIRKFLSKDNFQRAYVQYNAIMLVRILADNPGKSFTKNLDVKFVATVKELLRDGRDMSVQQILRETLDTFETQKAEDETLAPLRDMWKKEKIKLDKSGMPQMPLRALSAPSQYHSPQNPQNQQNYFARNHKPRGLPPPHELAQRVEEAKTSSKLLLQVVQSTPPAEMIGNELLKEFVERCQSASRSIQGYIHSDNPAPDDDTLLTLIETNDQLSTAISRHQRALLQARRTLGAASVSPAPRAASGGLFEAPGSQPNGPLVAASFGPFRPPPGPPPSSPPRSPPRGPLPHRQTHPQDPFDDDRHEKHNQLDLMPAPLEPQNYGLPPQSISRTSHQMRASYLQPGYGSPTTTTGGYGDRGYDALNEGTARGVSGGGDPVSPEEVRKPVVYRF